MLMSDALISASVIPGSCAEGLFTTSASPTDVRTAERSDPATELMLVCPRDDGAEMVEGADGFDAVVTGESIGGK